MSAIAGIDVGGTFTDLYFADGHGEVQTLKVPSTPADPSDGLLAALTATGVAPDAIQLIVHGTTIATNAVIQRRGARTALVTTRGFRDVLELGRRDRPHMYGLNGQARPLVGRELRLEVTERLDARGQVVTPLDEQAVRAQGEHLATQGVQAVVVSFLHAYANPAHEQRAADILREVNGEWEIVMSHEVVNEYFEFERTSTAVVQGYLQPMVAGYARRLAGRLKDGGFAAPTLIVLSNGGVVPLADVPRRAARMVRSGPAAGVVAAAELASRAGYENIITGDMGGTSYDVAVVTGGKPKVTDKTLLDFRIPLKVPMVDVHTIGAGGGSIAGVDGAGIPRVGPDSAGAFPGPACYGNGATEATVTDANVVLGRIDWQRPIGRDAGAHLDLAAAQAAVDRFGQSIGLERDAAATTILTLVNQNMAGRTRLLSVEQGLDPRDFTFVCFGGAGPLHGAAVMREVGMARMLVPPDPGVLCAMGCCIADLRHDVSITLEREIGTLADGELASLAARQGELATAELSGEGVDPATISLGHSARMCYRGQIHALRVPLDDHFDSAHLEAAFALAYRQEFGNTLGDIPPVVVALESVATAPPPVRASIQPGKVESRAAKPVQTRRVFFDGWSDVPVHERGALQPGHWFDGPAIVEQPDSTIVIEPGMHVSVDALSNLVVELSA